MSDLGAIFEPWYYPNRVNSDPISTRFRVTQTSDGSGAAVAEFIWQSKQWTSALKWDANEILDDVGKVSALQAKAVAVIESAGLDLEQEALVDEAVTTSAIEGEALDRASVRSSVAAHLGLDTSGMPKNRNRSVDGLIEVLADATRNASRPLDGERLFSWHGALFPTGRSGLKSITVGNWRTGSDAMQVISGPLGEPPTVHFEAPPSNRLDGEMKTFFEWWNDTSNQLNGFVRAGIAHFWFVTIHPFDDGNGRIARALTDLALAQHDGRSRRYFSMSKEIVANRGSYYSVLEQSQRGNGDITHWLKWFLDTLARSISRSLDVVRFVETKAQFWTIQGDAALNARQRKVLDKLLNAGPDGYAGGMTNKKYVAIAKTSPATAKRDLGDLVSKGLLRVGPSRGRSAFYEIAWPSSD